MMGTANNRVHVYLVAASAQLNKIDCRSAFSENILLVATGNVLCHCGNWFILTSQSEFDFWNFPSRLRLNLDVKSLNFVVVVVVYLSLRSFFVKHLK